MKQAKISQERIDRVAKSGWSVFFDEEVTKPREPIGHPQSVEKICKPKPTELAPNNLTLFATLHKQTQCISTAFPLCLGIAHPLAETENKLHVAS